MKIILASASPRRIELLRNAGVMFDVVPADIDETPQKKESPLHLVKRLSKQKATAIALQMDFKNAVIIGADTTVVHPNGKKILNKPQDLEESSAMIRALQGKTHTVLTGLCVLAAQDSKLKIISNPVIRTKVSIRKLTADEMDSYVRTKEGMDKAGAYAAQGIGMGLISKINGSYTSVVGLPVDETLAAIRKAFK